MESFMKGKKGVIMGVANKMSIAWGIADFLFKNGAEIALTYQGEVMEKRVIPLAAEINSPLVVSCDVGSDESIDQAFSEIEKKMGKIDFLVHAIAFSDKNELRGGSLEITRD